MPRADIRQAFEIQVEACDSLGSPFTAAVVEACLACLDETTGVGRRILAWTGDPTPRGDALALRLAGALHALAMAGQGDLAPLYPPAPTPRAGTLHAAVAKALASQGPFILEFLDRAPQTNEVGRSAVLYAGLIAAAAATTRDLEVLELGSSAGLNLLLDSYAYDFGGRGAGTPDASLLLRPRWTGRASEGPEPAIVERRGCDLAPIAVTDPAERRRLRAYIWADQLERLARLDAAVAIAMDDPPPLDRMDAAQWVEDRLTRPHRKGVTRVLMHSIALQYLPADGQERVRRAMDHAGSRATAEKPLAWLAFEQADGGPELTLRTWPGGERRRLGRADPHVSWIDWD